ncbi:nascent polypeptide-associated complex subunit alpha, muscle-specific form [Drosophila subpulchrella]|uniref:nascent polypeptide-associated complex subunit alpha, muscle-specific form n=1 Tax=Drosophila subpulchrella TaxID=1486046 RepID=UPI0018A17050|nr:nascent polypeptide-associated complex subunit alpha, muscle-specific form [Drosophila subpulchrella]
MDSKDNFSLGKPAEMEKKRRDSSNPEDASISTGQPAATSTPTNLIRKSARVVVLRRKTVESDLRNSSLVGRIPESWGHIKGRKNIRAPETPERAPRTRNISCSPRTPYTSKQPKTPRSANRLAGLVKEKYAQIKGRKQIQALSSPKTEPQSSLKTPKTPKGSPKTTTSKKHPKSSTKAPKMSPTPINLPTKNPAKMPVKSLTNTPKQSPIKSAMISPTNSPIQSTNYLPAKSATGSPKTPRKISSRKSSIESPKFSPIISPKTSPIPSPINTSIEPPKSLTKLPTSSPKKSLTDAPKAGSSEVGLLTAGAIIAPSDLRVGNKRSLASSEPTSVGNASTSESSPKRARLHVLQVSMGSPFSMTRSKKIKKVEVDQDDDEPVSIEISGNEGQDGFPEVLSEPEGFAPGSGMDPQMEPGLEPGVEPGLEPDMQPEIIDAITSPEANANTSMKCIVM